MRDPAQVASLPFTSYAVSSIVLSLDSADLNADGTDDFAVLQRGAVGLILSLAGQLVDYVLLGPTFNNGVVSRFATILLHDLDLDGDLDLAHSNFSNIEFFENLGVMDVNLNGTLKRRVDMVSRPGWTISRSSAPATPLRSALQFARSFSAVCLALAHSRSPRVPPVLCAG